MRAGPQQNAVGCAVAGSFVGVRLRHEHPCRGYGRPCHCHLPAGRRIFAPGPHYRMAAAGADRNHDLPALLAGAVFCPQPGVGGHSAGRGAVHGGTAADKTAGGAAAGGRAAAVALPWRNFDVFQPVWRWVWLPAVRVGIGAGTAAPAVRLAEQPARCLRRSGLPVFCTGVVRKLCPSLADAAVRRPAAGCRGSGTPQPKSRKDMGQHSARTVAAGRGTGAAQRAGRPAVRRKRRERAGWHGIQNDLLVPAGQRAGCSCDPCAGMADQLSGPCVWHSGAGLAGTCQLGGGAVGPAAPRRQWAGTVCGGADCIAVLAGHLAGHRCPDGPCSAVLCCVCALCGLAVAGPGAGPRQTGRSQSHHLCRAGGGDAGGGTDLPDRDDTIQPRPLAV